MSPENFVYWLNGFVELTGEKPSDEQWKSIKYHLGLAMTKITPVVINQKILPSDLYKVWRNPKIDEDIATGLVC